MDWKTVDREMTPWRTKIKDLQTQLGIGAQTKIKASKGCFRCEHWESCYASVSNQCKKNKVSKGDWTYVGYQYGKASVAGKKARILFVSMSRGYGTKYEEFESTQAAFRNSAYCPKPKHKHMKGVKAELELLLDEASPEERCQQFALTNAVRCRHFSGSGSMKFNATRTMKKNCEHHTKAIIQALEPDIIIAQGKPPSNSMCKLFSPKRVECYSTVLPAEIRQGEIGNKKVLFLLTAHPATPHYFRFSWKMETCQTN